MLNQAKWIARGLPDDARFVALAALQPPSVALVLWLRYGDPPLTQAAVARRLGVSHGRPGQLEALGLRRLRHPTRRAAVQALLAEWPLLADAVWTGAPIPRALLAKA